MVYETIIGPDFHKLHPKLKERYQLQLGETFKSQGIMEAMETKPSYLKPVYRILSKLKFIVPESGKNIAFEMQYTLTHVDKKTAVFQWVRKFYFPSETYEFHTRMVVDFETGVVKDYMGAPSVVNSHLQFDVTKDGELMTRSIAVEVVIGNTDIPTPKALAPNALVLEGFDEKTQQYTIHLSIFHPLLGTMMRYAGKFRAL